jgi:DNA-directed RNA polymerase subunit F
MLRLEDLQNGLSLVGLEPSVVATIAAVVPISEDSVQVIYKTPDGTLKDRLLSRADEENISIAVAERPWSRALSA